MSTLLNIVTANGAKAGATIDIVTKLRTDFAEGASIDDVLGSTVGLALNNNTRINSLSSVANGNRKKADANTRSIRSNRALVEKLKDADVKIKAAMAVGAILGMAAMTTAVKSRRELSDLKKSIEQTDNNRRSVNMLAASMAPAGSDMSRTLQINAIA